MNSRESWYSPYKLHQLGRILNVSDGAGSDNDSDSSVIVGPPFDNGSVIPGPIDWEHAGGRASDDKGTKYRFGRQVYDLVDWDVVVPQWLA